MRTLENEGKKSKKILYIYRYMNAKRIPTGFAPCITDARVTAVQIISANEKILPS